MTRKIRDAHFELLKDKTAEEQIAFYRQKSLALLVGIKIVKQAQRPGATPGSSRG